MSYIPSPNEALEILKKYNEEPFHIEHGETVGKVMKNIAKKSDAQNVDFWHAVGILHDIDFELYPEEHCKKAKEMLDEMDMDDALVHAVISHGYGQCCDIKPEAYMEKILFAVDELTGLIGAAALMRPTGISDMEVKSISKKYKDKKFAAGCSREVIAQGSQMLGIELNELFEMTLGAMKEE